MKGKRNLGIVFMALPFAMLFILPLYALTTFFTQLASQGTVVAEGTASGGELAMLIGGVVGQGLAFLGILAVISIILLPFGLYLSSRYSVGFSIPAALRNGWAATKRHFWMWVGILVFFVALEIVASVVTQQLGMAVGSVVAIVLFFLYFLIMIGLFTVGLAHARGQDVSFGTLFSGASLILKMIAGMILYTLIILVGFILVLIPGIIWMYKYQLFYFYIVDKKMGPIEALKASGQATKGAKLDMFSFQMLTQVLMLVSMIPFFLGLFVTFPLTVVASAHMYLQLSGQVDKTAPGPQKVQVSAADLVA